ncbi:MAG: arginine N-succinyltransferase [Sphingobium sp.]
MVSAPWFVRPAGIADLDAIYDLAGQTGPGFTNLPADRDGLRTRLERSDASFDRDLSAPDDELYIFLLEESGTGRIGGTAMIFSRIGVTRPFYSYKITRLSQYSRELDRIVTTDVLNLVNDFAGASEVGGLFLLPDLRTGGLGKLLARSRYLFMAMHRERISDLVLTELRGYQEPDGVSPFWDGLTRRFFDLEFHEADRFHALNGNQFVADLMPKYPIYTKLLSPEAQAAIGKPHRSGVAAMKMLEAEGFHHERYVDLFDAGPTLQCEVDRLRTVREGRLARVTLTGGAGDGEPMLVATGRCRSFRVMQARGLYSQAADALRLSPAGLPRGLLGEGDPAFFVTLG